MKRGDLLHRVSLGKPYLALGSLVLGAALAVAAFVVANHQNAPVSRLNIDFKGPVSQGPCQGSRGNVATVGELTAPVSASDQSNYRHAIEGYDANFVVVSPSAAQSRSSSLTKTAILHATSSNPKYTTCDYRASDSPAAQSVIRVAAAFLENQGALTADQADASSTMQLVSDDPMHSGRLIVSFQLEKPIAARGKPLYATPPSMADSVTPYAVAFDTATGQVVGGGRAHWYDFSTAP